MNELTCKQALEDAENDLRDLIELVLRGNYGVSQAAVEKWESYRKKEEEIKSSVAERNILYYADLSELINILKNNWQKFKPVFGENIDFLSMIKKIIPYRHRDSHRRELLPFQQSLIMGVSGEIRNSILLWRSNLEDVRKHFPYISYVKDSLGNIAKDKQKYVHCEKPLYPGDQISFVVKAFDPLSEDLEYGYMVYADVRTGQIIWSEDDKFLWKITENNISMTQFIEVQIRSKRKYHAQIGFDDVIRFNYKVYPKI